MDEKSAQDRIDAQVSDQERLAVADVVIDTGGDLAETLDQTDALWEQLTTGRL